MIKPLLNEWFQVVMEVKVKSKCFSILSALTGMRPSLKWAKLFFSSVSKTFCGTTMDLGRLTENRENTQFYWQNINGRVMAWMRFLCFQNAINFGLFKNINWANWVVFFVSFIGVLPWLCLTFSISFMFCKTVLLKHSLVKDLQADVFTHSKKKKKVLLVQ